MRNAFAALLLIVILPGLVCAATFSLDLFLQCLSPLDQVTARSDTFDMSVSMMPVRRCSLGQLSLLRSFSSVLF